MQTENTINATELVGLFCNCQLKTRQKKSNTQHTPVTVMVRTVPIAVQVVWGITRFRTRMLTIWPLTATLWVVPHS